MNVELDEDNRARRRFRARIDLCSVYRKWSTILRGGLQIELEMVLVLDYHDSSSVAQKQKMIHKYTLAFSIDY